MAVSAIFWTTVNAFDTPSDERVLQAPNWSQPGPTTLCPGWPLGPARCPRARFNFSGGLGDHRTRPGACRSNNLASALRERPGCCRAAAFCLKLCGRKRVTVLDWLRTIRQDRPASWRSHRRWRKRAGPTAAMSALTSTGARATPGAFANMRRIGCPRPRRHPGLWRNDPRPLRQVSLPCRREAGAGQVRDEQTPSVVLGFHRASRLFFESVGRGRFRDLPVRHCVINTEIDCQDQHVLIQYNKIEVSRDD